MPDPGRDQGPDVNVIPDRLHARTNVPLPRLLLRTEDRRGPTTKPSPRVAWQSRILLICERKDDTYEVVGRGEKVAVQAHDTAGRPIEYGRRGRPAVAYLPDLMIAGL